VVLVDHAAEDPPSSYRGVDRDDCGRIVVRWTLREALVWTVSVEVRHVFVEDRAGVAFVPDQDPVGALGTDAADEPFGMRVGPSRQLHPMSRVGGSFGVTHPFHPLFGRQFEFVALRVPTISSTLVAAGLTIQLDLVLVNVGARIASLTPTGR
jgi:hypothetical protein